MSSLMHQPNSRQPVRRLRLARMSAAIAVGLALAYAPLQSMAQTAPPASASAAPASPHTAPAQKKKTKASKKKHATNIATVTVTGVRASMESAIAIKRNATQIVDSIVAEDIGKLPDNNVAEALQRISGIQISRNYGEGSSIAIRGLTQVRTEVNGRDAFTANGGRALSFEDVPAELLAGIDVYKDPAADIPPGGIGGTVNLRTHKPFDFAGRKIAATVEYDYFDLAKKGKPSASALYSNRWHSDSYGDFGVLVDLAYQKHSFRQDVISTEPFYAVKGGSSAQGNYPGHDGQTLYVPHGGGVGETYGDRRRLGTDLALQWRPNDSSEYDLQVLRSDYKFQWRDYSYFAYTSDNPIIPDPGKPFGFGPDGNFQYGTFNGTGGLDADGNFDGTVTPGIGVDSNSSLATRHSVTTDVSLTGSWNVSHSLTLNSDLQYIKARTNEVRYILNTHANAPYFTQDIRGGLPTLTVPDGYLTDPDNNSYGYALDHIDKSTGREVAWTGGGEYTLDNDVFHSFKFGLRTTNRRAVTKSTPYRFLYIGQPLSNFADSSWVVNSYSDFFRGNADVFGATIAPNPSLLEDYPGSLSMFGTETALEYTPSDVNRQGQKTYAGYAMLYFGFDNGAIPVDGNIGVRVVRTNVTAEGVMTDPTGSGGTLPVDVDRSYNEVLPSFNLIAHLTDKLQWRFAASKAISRPSFDDMNPYLSLSTPDASGTNNYTGSAGNPDLGPMTARQFDTSLEWYFSRSGLLYGDLFYKKVDGFIAHGVFNETYGGHVYKVSRPVNGDNGVIKGAEAGYQSFFDFLPAPFDGLGVQLNYTYVYSKAPSPQASDTSGETLKVPLEGLSKNSYNAILMYEKGPISARVAYNWRSNWVVTTQGNGTGNLPIYDNAFGQLDASVTYHVNKHFALTLSGTNVTNTRRGTQFGLAARPRDVQVNDRMYALKAQLSF